MDPGRHPGLTSHRKKQTGPTIPGPKVNGAGLGKILDHHTGPFVSGDSAAPNRLKDGGGRLHVFSKNRSLMEKNGLANNKKHGRLVVETSLR